MSGRGCVAWEGGEQDGAEEEGMGKVAILYPDLCPPCLHIGQIPQDGENGQNVAFFCKALL